MSSQTRDREDRGAPTSKRNAASGAAGIRPRSDEPTLDQLLAEPIVQLLMRRDRTDEATIRLLLQGIDQPASSAKDDRKGDDRKADDPLQIAWLLQKTDRLWRRHRDQAVRTRFPGMSFARCMALISLARHEASSQAALARILGIRSATLVRLLDRMEAAGFVAREPNPNDRRAHILTLTAKALPVIEYINDLTRKSRDDPQFGLSRSDAIRLLALLFRIWSNLQDPAGEVPTSGAIRSRDVA